MTFGIGSWVIKPGSPHVFCYNDQHDLLVPHVLVRFEFVHFTQIVGPGQ